MRKNSDVQDLRDVLEKRPLDGRPSTISFREFVVLDTDPSENADVGEWDEVTQVSPASPSDGSAPPGPSPRIRPGRSRDRQ